MHADIISKLSLTVSSETFGGCFPPGTVVWFYENDIYCVETYKQEGGRVNCLYFFRFGSSVTLTEESAILESQTDIDDTLLEYLFKNF